MTAELRNHETSYRGPSGSSSGSILLGASTWLRAPGATLKTRLTQPNEANGRASPRIKRGLIVCAYPEAVSPETDR